MDKTKPRITACKQYCLAAGATQGNIAYTQNVVANAKKTKMRDMFANYRKKKANAQQAHCTCPTGQVQRACFFNALLK